MTWASYMSDQALSILGLAIGTTILIYTFCWGKTSHAWVDIPRLTDRFEAPQVPETGLAHLQRWFSCIWTMFMLQLLGTTSES